MTIDDVLSLIETQQKYNEWMAKRYEAKGNKLAWASSTGAVAGLARLKAAIKDPRNQTEDA